jgi:hypothetical protein
MESVADRTVDWLKFKNPEAPPSRCDRPGSRDGCGRPPRLVAPHPEPENPGWDAVGFFLRTRAAVGWRRTSDASRQPPLVAVARWRSFWASRRHSSASLRRSARRPGLLVCSAERTHSSACWS